MEAEILKIQLLRVHNANHNFHTCSHVLTAKQNHALIIRSEEILCLSTSPIFLSKNSSKTIELFDVSLITTLS